ncbi:MAG TPA: MlaD family protein [Flavobacteriales bacterium]|nr:MlaD family protein [Flavobacteriales bacterium]
MSNKLKSVIVGVVSLFAIGALYWGTKFLSGEGNPFKDKRVFYAYYDDIAGLTEGNSVTIKGYKVGTVTQIYFDKERDNHLKVVMNIEDDIQIPLNTEAKIVSLDLMGTKGISLILSDDTDMAPSGSQLNSSISKSLQEQVDAQILPLKDKAEELIGSMDSVMMIVTAVLNKDVRESLSKSLVSLDQTFTTLSETMLVVDKIVKDNQENINTTLSAFSSVSENLKSSNEEINNILTNFSSLSDSLSKADIVSTLSKIDEITNKINRSEGSLGQLINDKELYKNFKSASKELKELIEDMKLHPERYVNFSIIGTPNKPYKEPKSE